MESKTYKCLKLVVEAKILRGSEVISIGNNNIRNNVSECPRINMKTGEGYELCKSVCNQEAHAEIIALKNAGDKDLTGCILEMKGQIYICDECKTQLNKRGITEYVFI